MSQKIKVRFTCNYLKDDELYHLLINQHKYFDHYCFEIVSGNSFDYLVVFNYSKKKYIPSKTIVFIQEPSWSTYVSPKYLDRWSSVVFFHDKRLLNLKRADIVEKRSYLPYYSNKPLNETLNTNLDKTRKMSYIVSGIQGSHNYHLRLELLNKILDSDLPIDIYGRGLNILDKRYKGSPDDKFDGLRNYKYSIAIENTSERNYVTEKFTDCIYNLTVPIYHGATNIEELFIKDSYLALNISDPLSQIGDILVNDPYNLHLTQILGTREQLISKDNLFYTLHEWLKKYGTPLNRSTITCYISTAFKKIYFPN